MENFPFVKKRLHLRNHLFWPLHRNPNRRKSLSSSKKGFPQCSNSCISQLLLVLFLLSRCQSKAWKNGKSSLEKLLILFLALEYWQFSFAKQCFLKQFISILEFFFRPNYLLDCRQFGIKWKISQLVGDSFQNWLTYSFYQNPDCPKNLKSSKYTK